MSEINASKQRLGFYVRKADGRRVVAHDWEDGLVTWMLDPIPAVASNIVGTCTATTFAESFDKLAEPA